MAGRNFRLLCGLPGRPQSGDSWYKKIDDKRYHVIKLLDWHKETGETDEARYLVSLSELDLNFVNDREILDFIGWPPDKKIPTPLVLVNAVASYGQSAPLGDWYGNNIRSLLKAARNESRRLIDDPEYYELRMNRPINLIGTTARECQQGNLLAGLRHIDRTTSELCDYFLPRYSR